MGANSSASKSSRFRAIATPNLPDAQVGAGYSASLSLSGGTAPYSWTLTGDQLPPGLSFEAGIFSGTPLASGSSSFTIQVTDGAMGSATVSATLTRDAAPPVPIGGNYALFTRLKMTSQRFNFGRLNVRLSRHVALFNAGRYDWAGTLRGTVQLDNWGFSGCRMVRGRASAVHAPLPVN